MFVSIFDVPAGTEFKSLGHTSVMVRVTDKVQKNPNRNQWGRATGGTHDARVCVVKSPNHRYADGFGPAHYVAYPLNFKVQVD